MRVAAPGSKCAIDGARLGRPAGREGTGRDGSKLRSYRGSFRDATRRAQRPPFQKTRRHRGARLHTWGGSPGSPDSSARPLLHHSRLRPVLIRSERHGELGSGRTMCQLRTQLETGPITCHTLPRPRNTALSPPPSPPTPR